MSVVTYIKVDEIIQIWMICMIQFWMTVNVFFLSHPKLEVLYNPLLDDSEHACKSSKGGSFVQSTLFLPSWV